MVLQGKVSATRSLVGGFLGTHAGSCTYSDTTTTRSWDGCWSNRSRLRRYAVRDDQVRAHISHGPAVARSVLTPAAGP